MENSNVIDKGLGWMPDPADKRDIMFSLPSLQAPKSVYLTNSYRLPKIMDQGSLGSCTVNSVSYQVQFNLLNNKSLSKSKHFVPSRLFMYYYVREAIGTIPFDSGGYLRDAIKVAAHKGSPREAIWPYDIPKFADAPPQEAIDEGLNFQSLKYERVNNRDKTLLVNALMRGYPICFGMYVFPSFVSREVARTGIVPLPDTSKEQPIGGHAITIVGYHEKFDAFIVPNSWGTEWGQKGYCRIPAAYLTNPQLADDFWIITEME